MEIYIEKVDNGYILRHECEDYILKHVIEEKEEMEAMKEVLKYVKEFFGVFYSKHNEKNLEVEIK